MTVSTSVVRVSYTGDGTSVAFTVPWLFYASTDLLVLLGGSSQSSGYSVTGAGSGSGTVTFSSPPAAGVNVQIVLNPPLTQLTNLVDGTAFPSATINQVNDRAIQCILRLNDLLSRTVRAPDGDIASWSTLPAAATRANQALLFDSNGLPTVGSLPGLGSTPQTFLATAGQTAFNLTSAPASVNGLTVVVDGATYIPGVDYTLNGTQLVFTVGLLAGQRVYTTYQSGSLVSTAAYLVGDVRTYGADPTGINDSGVSFTNAGLLNGDIIVPAGTYSLQTAPTFGQGIYHYQKGVNFTGANAALAQPGPPSNAFVPGPVYSTGDVDVQLNTASTDYATRLIVRNANHSGGTPGNVISGLKVATIVGAGVANYEWSVLGLLYNSATGGQNVAGYFQGNRMTTGAGPTWGGVCEVREVVPINDPTSGLIGLEVDNRSNGTDANFNRVALDVVCARLNPAGAATTVGFGVRLQAGSDANVTIVNGFSVWRANVGVAFDCANALSVTSGALRMPALVPILFDAAGANQLLYDNTGLQYRSGGNPQVRLNADGSIAFGGSTLPAKLNGTSAATATAGGGQATPGTVLGYLVGSFSGTPIKVAYYAN